MTIEKISDDELRETTTKTICKDQLVEAKESLEKEMVRAMEPYNKALSDINGKLGLFEVSAEPKVL